MLIRRIFISRVEVIFGHIMNTYLVIRAIMLPALAQCENSLQCVKVSCQTDSSHYFSCSNFVASRLLCGHKEVT
jgi:hypothetical protein